MSFHTSIACGVIAAIDPGTDKKAEVPQGTTWGYRDGAGIAGQGNSLSRIYFLNSIPSKQVCGIWLHPRDQKCSVLCWWPLSGRQHRQEALQGPPSGPAGWLQHSWHRIHWRPKGEGGQCQEFWGQAHHVAWQIKMIAGGFLGTDGSLGISFPSAAATLNATGLQFNCGRAAHSPVSSLPLLSCWVVSVHERCQARSTLRPIQHWNWVSARDTKIWSWIYIYIFDFFIYLSFTTFAFEIIVDSH